VGVFSAGAEVSARVDLANMSSEGAGSLVKVVLGARISNIEQVVEIVVPVRIGGENWIVCGRRQEDGSSLIKQKRLCLGA
jgi:hypothetical protein